MALEPVRPVPRNIDAPNRTMEYMIAFLAGYYGAQFAWHHPGISFGCGGFLLYIMFKLTDEKPEGMLYRVLYKFITIGSFVPNPRQAPKFEI